MVSSPSYIAVDLSQSNICSALASLQKFKTGIERITTARVYTSVQSTGIHDQDLIRVFGIIGNFPNLKHVQVNLRYAHFPNHGAVPLEALACLLQGGKSKTGRRRLKSLQFRNVHLSSSSSGQAQRLCDALKCQKRLQEIEVVDCTGRMAAFFSAVSMHAKNLRRLRVDGTLLGSSWTWVNLCEAHPALRSLQLEDVPDINDDKMADLANALRDPQCRIQELVIASSIVTDKSGNVLTEMLLVNQSIRHLTLHLDCERLGTAMANCMKRNSNLRSLDVRCYGDDDNVLDDIIQLSHALYPPKTDMTATGATTSTGGGSNLQKLRLRLEIEPYEFGQIILDTFGAMMPHNDTLQELVLDDGSEHYPLPTDTQLKLKLNECGYSKYRQASLQGKRNDKHQMLFDALVAGKDDPSVSFSILSNHPQVIVEACQEAVYAGEMQTDTAQPVGSSKTIKSMTSKQTPSGAPHPFPTVKTTASSRMPRRTTSKSLRRRVLSILAPSA